MINVDMALGVIALCFVSNWGMRKGRQEKVEADKRAANAQADYRRQGYDKEHNVREERKLKAEKERWLEWTVEREHRKEEQAERREAQEEERRIKSKATQERYCNLSGDNWTVRRLRPHHQRTSRQKSQSLQRVWRHVRTHFVVVGKIIDVYRDRMAEQTRHDRVASI
jgi:flagellar biosynthesis GTPase FlhF